jgi:outer membrane protein assembly factor BamB
MRNLVLLSAVFLAACASTRAVRKPEPVLQRGWSFVEGEKEFLAQDAGVAQVSFSAPVLAAEKIVFGSDRFGITALAKRNGQILWQKKIADGIAAQPYVDATNVYAGSEGGVLRKYDINSGRTIWEVTLTGPVHGAPIYAFQRLYVGTADEALHAIDTGTGKVLWTYRRPAFNSTSIRGGGNPAAIAGKIWIGFSDGALVSLDPETGAVDSEKIYRDNLKFMDIDARVVGWKDGLLVVTYDGKLRHTKRDGTLIWEFPAGGARAPLVTDGETIYLPSSEGTVYAIGAKGNEIWRRSFRRGVPSGLGVVNRNGKKVLVNTTTEDKVYALDAGSGAVLGESSLGHGSGSFAPLAIDEKTGSVYVLSNYSRVHEYLLHL